MEQQVKKVTKPGHMNSFEPDPQLTLSNCGFSPPAPTRRHSFPPGTSEQDTCRDCGRRRLDAVGSQYWCTGGLRSQSP